MIKKRTTLPENIAKLSTTLRNHDLDHVLQNNDPQNAYSSFIHDYTDMHNANFPLKSFKIGYKTRKTWLTEGMKTSIKLKKKIKNI